MTAAKRKVHGGFALPFESYPEPAWRRFVFHPDESANLIGVRPNPAPNDAAQHLYDAVVAERKRTARQ